ncbi:hypothetical protein PPACK8108_LOCUS15181 [Phakopsora pachyrhizi]|uniref:Uncharacterized protein n=1 Tax=Phakopsora pachyrhizi TaxID=170000 RepID=A0AAV0B9F7_PHAPC|nr:hypothetical protein PPACK8108_LOCUS15181 [Phakopsora pachyrhizi]
MQTQREINQIKDGYCTNTIGILSLADIYFVFKLFDDVSLMPDQEGIVAIYKAKYCSKKEHKHGFKLVKSARLIRALSSYINNTQPPQLELCLSEIEKKKRHAQRKAKGKGTQEEFKDRIVGFGEGLEIKRAWSHVEVKFAKELLRSNYEKLIKSYERLNKDSIPNGIYSFILGEGKIVKEFDSIKEDFIRSEAELLRRSVNQLLKWRETASDERYLSSITEILSASRDNTVEKLLIILDIELVHFI